MAATTLVYFAFFLMYFVHADADCVTQTAGDLSGRNVPIETVYLTPPTYTWDVPVPNACAPGRVVGLQTTVCDPDSAPGVTIVPFEHILVVRANNPPSPGSTATVDTAVYCG